MHQESHHDSKELSDVTVLQTGDPVDLTPAS